MLITFYYWWFVDILWHRNENTKTVYPISDPEFSRKASRTESVVSGVPKKEPEFCVELQYETVAIASQPPPTVVHAQSVESDQPSRPVSGKHVQDHSSRVQTPTKNSFAPVDTEGTTLNLSKWLEGGSQVSTLHWNLRIYIYQLSNKLLILYSVVILCINRNFYKIFKLQRFLRLQRMLDNSCNGKILSQKFTFLRSIS